MSRSIAVWIFCMPGNVSCLPANSWDSTGGRLCSGDARRARWENGQMVHGNVGPMLEFPIPLFDQGQARIGRAAAELRTAQQEYYALAVRIRATARAIRDRMQGARDRALILSGHHVAACRSASSMRRNCTTTPCNLVRSNCCAPANSRSRPAVAYIEALRDYWLARGEAGADLERSFAGSRRWNRRAGPSGRLKTRWRDPEGH